MFNIIKNNNTYKFGFLYIIIITLISALINVFTWNMNIPNLKVYITIMALSFTLWFLFYVPLYKFIKEEQWDNNDFGVVFNKRTFVVSSIIIIFIFYKIGVNSISYENLYHFIIEGFARVSEEFFYRGFIFIFILKIFKNKENKWIYAVIGSSFLFTIMHTQTFLPGNNLNMFNIFINAILLGLSRQYTKSILPAVIFHSASNGGIVAMISGILFYLVLYKIILLMQKKYQSDSSNEKSINLTTNHYV